jgi:thiamine biosynthesis lipoprotein
LIEMHEITFRAMGSQVRVIMDTGEPAAEAALRAAPGWFETWEQYLSRFRPQSELSRLNRRRGRRATVSPVLGQVLQLALAAARESDGLVTPTVLDALESIGYTDSFDQPVPFPHSHTFRGGQKRCLQAGASAPERAAGCPGLPSPARGRGAGGEGLRAEQDAHPIAHWSGLAYDPQRRAVSIPAGVRLDLGGVAKGWAADTAMRRLSHAYPVLVDAGGDIAVSGPRACGAPWAVGVADPHDPAGLLDVLLVAGGGVATSGRDYRRWRQQGRWQHHIIDPRTGRPAATDILSATVVAPDVVAAEVAAKTALILGSEAGLAWLLSRPHLAGLLALEDGRVLRTPSLAPYRSEGDDRER